MFHDHAAHGGVNRIQRLLSTRVYWPRMNADVIEYVKQCHECALAKPPFFSSHMRSARRFRFASRVPARRSNYNNMIDIDVNFVPFLI